MAPSADRFSTSKESSRYNMKIERPGIARYCSIRAQNVEITPLRVGARSGKGIVLAIAASGCACIGVNPRDYLQFEEVVAVELHLFNRLIDIGKGRVSAALDYALGKFGFPALAEFLECADVEIAIVKVDF